VEVLGGLALLECSKLRAGGVAQMVEFLLSKLKVPNSSSNITFLKSSKLTPVVPFLCL
jgi:hypothetical protein